MKRLNSLFIILLTFAAFNVGAQADVGCTAVNTPMAGDTIYAGIPVQPNYTRKSFGSAIPANHPDQIIMVVAINGDSVAGFYRNMQNAFTADETIGGQPIDFGTVTPTLSDGNQEVCIYTLMANDADPKNDTSCVTVYYSQTPPASDVAVTAVSVTDPVPSGTSFEAGSTLNKVAFTLENTTTKDIPAGGTASITLEVGGNSQNLNLNLNNGIAAGATTNATADRAQITNLLDFPTTLGNFDVCVTVGYVGDNNATNDKFCTTYTLTPNTTPNITSYFPGNGKCKETVTIAGTNFGATVADNVVKFRGKVAKVLTASTTELTVEVPEGIANGNISVEVTVNGNTKKGETVTPFVYDGCDVVVDPKVGITEINNLFGKVYYSNNSLNVVANGNNSGVKQIQIMNMAGQIIFEEARDLQASSVEVIDMSTAPNGMYVVNIEGYSTSFVK